MRMLKEAYLYEKREMGAVKCNLCGWRCTIMPGKRGVCGVRENIDGTLFSLVYGKAISYGIDPIEKKPLFHFHPGTTAFSIATVGCNFRCEFCDNWVISQNKEISGESLSPDQVVSMAKQNGCRSISYTYTEPTIFFEYAFDTSKLAHAEGICNTFVTNGYLTPEAIDMISPYLDAATVDFKGSGEPEFYKRYCGINAVSPIFEALEEMRRRGIFIEVTNLIVPGGGDKRAPFVKLVDWVIEHLGGETPFHILRFFPSFKYTRQEETPERLLLDFWQAATDAGLKHVYLGNVRNQKYENSYCPSCKKTIIERWGFEILSMNLDGRRCHFCGAELNFVL
ncbi:MAG: AmmeMemoRadiSam system radical SAM enzyme [Candidatus Methanomethylicia archaeon]|nr:AmmeMemoRadiSam system radical SAM enzyme [Candidatus Methanomethylicia archaeon]